MLSSFRTQYAVDFGIARELLDGEKAYTRGLCTFKVANKDLTDPQGRLIVEYLSHQVTGTSTTYML